MKIEKVPRGGMATVRLIGHFHSEHVGELQKQLLGSGTQFILDLKEVTIVDVDVVRFFGSLRVERYENPPLLSLYSRMDLEGAAKERMSAIARKGEIRMQDTYQGRGSIRTWATASLGGSANQGTWLLGQVRIRVEALRCLPQ